MIGADGVYGVVVLISDIVSCFCQNIPCIIICVDIGFSGYAVIFPDQLAQIVIMVIIVFADAGNDAGNITVCTICKGKSRG